MYMILKSKNFFKKDPEPKENWDGVLDAYDDDTAIMNRDQEDCLYLNVYTPKVSNA